jgi:hypothetical protein
MGCPMNAHPRPRALSPALLLALCLGAGGLSLAGAAGCADEKKQIVAEGDAGASGPQKPVLDGKLAAAVKAAESAQPSSPSKDGADGPPESGIFGPGLADKAMPRGAPPKIEVLSDGREPRSVLAAAPADEQKEGVSLTVRIQQGSIPGDFALALKIDKPKDDKKTDGPKVTRVVAKVVSASAPPQAPRDLSDKLGKLKGTEVRYSIGPDGGASDVAYTLPKDTEPGLGDLIVKALADTVSVAVPPLPRKPVGAGAYWMVTDRSTAFGVEVLRYRVYKIEQVNKDGVSLSVDLRQYAAKEDADLGAIGGGQKMTLQRFESNGKAKFDWTPAGLLPTHGDTTVRTGLGGMTGGQQGVLQAEMTARFSDGSDKKK